MASEDKNLGRPRLYDDPDAFAAKTDEYFASVETSGKAPTIAGLCLFLGFVSRDSFGEYEKYGPAFSPTVKSARLRIEEDRNQRLMDRSGFTPGVIFDLKNNHGWTDRSALEHSGPNGGPIPVQHALDLSGMTDDQLAALAPLLAGLARQSGEPPESDQGGTGEEEG